MVIKYLYFVLCTAHKMVKCNCRVKVVEKPFIESHLGSTFKTSTQQNATSKHTIQITKYIVLQVASKPLKTTLVSTLLTAGIILPFVWCFLTLMLHCCWGTRLPLITLLFSGVTVSDSVWKPAQGVDFYLYRVAVNWPAYIAVSQNFHRGLPAHFLKSIAWPQMEYSIIWMDLKYKSIKLKRKHNLNHWSIMFWQKREELYNMMLYITIYFHSAGSNKEWISV